MHRGRTPLLSFYRDSKGAEVDLVVEDGRSLIAIETKSGRTVAADFFSGLDTLATVAANEKPLRRVRKVVVYGGDETQRRSDATALSWSDVDKESWISPAN